MKDGNKFNKQKHGLLSSTQDKVLYTASIKEPTWITKCRLSRHKKMTVTKLEKERPLILHLGTLSYSNLHQLGYAGRPSRCESRELFACNIPFSWHTSLNYLPSRPLAHGGLCWPPPLRWPALLRWTALFWCEKFLILCSFKFANSESSV